MQIDTALSGNERAAEHTAPSVWMLRWRAARAIARQELRDGVFGWTLYAVAALGVLLGVLFVFNSLTFVGQSGLLILARPFYVPVLTTATLALLYVAAWAALAIARPRDQGALRVLFFAPVDAWALLGGHVLAGVALYSMLLLLATPLLILLALLTNVPFPPLLLAGLLASPLFAAGAVAIGLCISAVAPTSRSAMFILGALLLVLLAVPVGYTALLNVPPTSRFYDALLFGRDLLRTARDLLGWVSPFSLLSGGLDAALRASWGELALRMLAALAGCGAWLALAVWGIRRRGVLP